MAIIEITSENHWHGLRKQCLGASDISALFNQNPYATRYDLFIDKTKGRQIIENPLMAWGNKMEPVIAAEIADQYSMVVKKSNEFYIHPEHPWLGCTPDYFIIESEEGPGILEVKNVVHGREWLSDQAPVYVEWQAQHQLLVINAARKAEGLDEFKYNCIGSLHGGNPEDIRLMYRTPELGMHKRIIEESSKFWSDIQNNIEPPIIANDLPTIVAETLASETQTEVLDFRKDDALDAAAARYKELSKEISEKKKEMDTIKANVLKDMQSHEQARTKHYILSAKESRFTRKAEEKEIVSLRFNIKEVSNSTPLGGGQDG